MKKIALFLISLLIITGCAVNNKPTPKINKTLPQVTNFSAYPDRNAIALKWDVVKGINGYYIQKFDAKNKKWQTLTTINDPYQTLYVDTDLKPSTVYMYRISTFDKSGIPSLAKEISQKTLPTVMQVIPLEAKPLQKGEIKIVFRPHPNERVQGYKIQKFNDDESKWENIADLSPRFNVEFIDKNLEDGKIYQYRIIAYTFDNLQSKPSQVIKVSTFPKPPVVENIKATNNLPKKIILTWSPVKGAAYYKVYTKSFFDTYKCIKKTKKTSYVDMVNKDGVTKYYKVTAVSKHLTESLLDKTPAAMGQTLPKPAKPIISLSLSDNAVNMEFTSPDDRAVKYLVIKKTGSLFDRHTYKYLLTTNKFTDKNVKHKNTYYYDVYAIDKYGLVSAPKEVEVDF